MKVLVAGTEIANNIFSFKLALLKCGGKVSSCCFSRNSYYLDNDYDYSTEAPSSIKSGRIRYALGLLIRAYTFFRILSRYDAFIYVWRDTFLPLKLDYLILRMLKKKVVVFHCGDDVRYRPIQSCIDRYFFNVHYFSPDDEQQILKYELSGTSFRHAFMAQWLTEKWGATAVSMRSHATFQAKPAYFFRFPQKELLSAPKRTNLVPLIIHAPTDRVGKGTDYVLRAIDKLKADGRAFEFELIEGKPNTYLLQRLSQADILLDQPGPWFGKLGMEALASGCVVISGNKHEYYGIEDTSPVIQFEPDAEYLAEQLSRIIDDYESREQLMRAGFNYWQEYYSESAFSAYVESIFMGGETGKFYPVVEHKKLILKYSKSIWQRFSIKLLYGSVKTK